MLRHLLLATLTVLLCQPLLAQITITANDMPVSGDSLRYSEASVLTAYSYIGENGTDKNWNFKLTPAAQGIDYYKKAVQVNPLFALSLGNLSCYGTKIADSIPGLSLLLSGINISDMYTFYNKKNNPPSFQAEAFGASIAGFPVGSAYTTPDVLYHFPLTYGDDTTTDFALNIGAPGVGGIKMQGYRRTVVDGWGTIITPYYTKPTPCIRVRSEIVETDSITMDSLSLGLPRTTVEYKWLVNGEHYPALWITTLSIAGFDVPLSVKYKDKYRPELNRTVRNITVDANDVFAYPNPARDGWVRFEIPNSWTDFTIELFDIQGKLAMSYINKRQLDVSGLPHGNYVVRLTSEGSVVYIKLLR